MCMYIGKYIQESEIYFRKYLALKRAKINMLFILKLVLIIVLNKAYAYHTRQAEVILLPAWNPSGVKKIPLTLKVFGTLIQLNLYRNDRIITPEFEIWKHNTNGIEKLSQLNTSNICYYFYKDRINSGALNFCRENGLEGFIILQSGILEITPLQNNLASSLMSDPYVKQANVSFGIPHLITRTLKYPTNPVFFFENNLLRRRRYARKMETKLTIELAVFLDNAAYHQIFPIVGKKEISNVILAYVNGIQAVFHHSSFGVPIDISLVHLEIMEKQLPNLPNDNTEDLEMLRKFCVYSTFHPLSDNNHWDIGLYLTGLQIYKIQENFLNYYSRGISYNGGACIPNYSCAVVEFGFQSVPVSTGFSSIYMAAHEIGHLLGMEHDLQNNICSKNKYVMSSEQGLRERTTWSSCSCKVAKKLWQTKPCLLDYSKPQNISIETALDHSRYHDLPGREWTAKKQCEIFMHDNKADAVTLHDMCISLQCDVPGSDKSFFAGPALDGTYCAPYKECRGGKCVPVRELPIASNLTFSAKGKWTEWESDSCKSYCSEDSKGVIIKRRFCEKQNYNATNCEGLSYDVVLCDDSKLCTVQRKTINEFIYNICGYFKYYLSELDGKGKQMSHDKNSLWTACAIFCRQNDGSYYTPRTKLIDLNVNPYLPDGTWCHIKNGQNYYCRKHYCLPESYQFE